MAEPSSIYWPKRQKQALRAIEAEEAHIKKRLAKYYRAESMRLQNEIAAFYQKYGKNNIIEFRTLQQRLSDAEKQLLYKNFEEFAQKHPELAHLQETRENIYKLNRLEGLEASIELQQMQIGETEINAVSEHLKKVGLISRDAVIDYTHAEINPAVARRYIDTQWAQGENFSQRIWKNRAALAQKLNTEIAQGCARGDSYQNLIKATRATFEHVSKRDAYRLIYTEGTYVYNETSAASFEESGLFSRYQISTAEDSKVCSVCEALKGQWFTFSERMPGVNFPPLHPWCRCSFIVDTGREV